jgi:sugar-specific transcriptional regulator TrmB
VSTKELFKKMGVPLDRLDKVLGGLEREGFIVRKRDYICIK